VRRRRQRKRPPPEEIAFKDGDTVRLWSRNGRDWSGEFVAITAAVRELPFNRIMLDGEAVAHCLEGLPDFHRLLGDGQASACAVSAPCAISLRQVKSWLPAMP
jgi:ATP-dependent DNA ligase